MQLKVSILFLAGVLLQAHSATACIWDAETLLQERLKSSDMATVILKAAPAPPDPAPLRKRIKDITASPLTNDPAWWNNLAGAHLRLGEAKEAAALLETVTNRFPNDYGIHANLGTAYHLMGRYQEAEREITRDLEINPAAHFGVERYHLALLQYLVRDAEYKKDHVYIDEWSDAFVREPNFRFARNAGKLSPWNTNGLDEKRLAFLERNWDGNSNGWPGEEIVLLKSNTAQRPPSYRYKWDLAGDPKFKDGVLYMATMNPKEPACFVMLGIACNRARDYNLAVAAFQKAIDLGSPQADILAVKIDALNHYITESHKVNWPIDGLLSLAPLAILVYLISKIKQWKRGKREKILPDPHSGSRPA
ncbi:MAG TPA: tetratricopeptide repeat protein [Verrucomicrobiae bacterium]|nr:tetratricopeptide repeat protein [Verrucomicrobiae bacterium]